MTIDIQYLTTYPISVFDWPLAGQAPFVWTDVFLQAINDQSQQIILHIWPMKETVILGKMDKLVPYFEAGLESIRQIDYQPVVRNLGGLAVVADDGVLNFTLFLPQGSNHFDIKEVYQLMADVVNKTLEPYGYEVEVGEVPQSYCPGNFDLSISGKKIAGLAQRRIGKAIAISIYISVSGNQKKRGQIVREFYQAGIQGQETNFHYPDIDPTCMTTLSDILEMDLSVEQIVQDLKEALQSLGAILKPYEVTDVAQERYYENLERNE